MAADLISAMQDAGGTLAQTLASGNAVGSRTRYGTVKKNNGTTLDVELCGATLAAVPMLTTCVGAAAGDRCILTIDGALVTVTGIIANAGNAPRVKMWKSGIVEARLCNGWCSVLLYGSTKTPDSWGIVTLATLPVGYRPSADMSFGGVAVQNNGTATCLLTIDTGGTVKLQGKGANGGYNTTDCVFGSGVYPVASGSVPA